MVDQFAEPLDLLAERGRIDGGDHSFEPRLDLHLLVFGQIVEVVGKSILDLLLPILLGVGENLLSLVAHALEAAAHGVDAGCEAALEHRHREGERAAAGAVVLRRLDGLVLDVPGQRVVEIVLVAIELEGGRADLALREELLHLAGLGIGKRDQRLLRAAKIERRVVPSHRLLEALHVAVDVAVEQFEEEAEVLRVALVRRRRHQKIVVGHRRQRLAELVGERLLVRAVGRHLVRLVDDDEVPVAAEQALLGVLDARNPGDRRDDLVLFLPRILAVVGAQHIAADHLELLAELVLQLALPLEAEIRRRDDQRALDEAADLQLLEEQARHDRLARAGVVGEQEADARQAHEVVVDGLELVRQRIDAGDRERKVRVVLVGEPETRGFDAKAEARRVAVEWLALGRRIEELELVEAQDTLVDLSGLLAGADDLDHVTERRDDEHLDGLRKHRPADDNA